MTDQPSAEALLSVYRAALAYRDAMIVGMEVGQALDILLFAIEAAAPTNAAPQQAAPECEHHWIGGNDGSWCTKCKVERPAPDPGYAVSERSMGLARYIREHLGSMPLETDGDLAALLDSLRGTGVSQQAVPEDSLPGNQCPSCYWHPGHEPDEWFAEEAKIRGYSAPASGRRDRPAATEQPAQESDVQRLKREGRLAPFPPAVVDYTERAREVVDSVGADIGADRVFGPHTWRTHIAVALNEVASEHQAAYLAKLSECEDFRASFETVERQCRDANRALRQARAERAALLARVQEPDVREAVRTAICERGGSWGMAEAALTAIKEMLK